MTDHDRAKVRGGEALRKHREKRRAKAINNSNSKPTSDTDAGSAEKNSYTASTEGSFGDVVDTPSENQITKEIMAEIVATTSDRDKMRKISILGLEDPADGARHGRHKNERRKEADIIIATEASREKMRKISMLGFEDPADFTEESNGKTSKEERRRDREKRPSSTGRARPRRLKGQRNKSDIACAPVEVPSDALEGDEPGQRRRSQSVDNDIPLFGDINLPNGARKQHRTKSLDLDQQSIVLDELIGDDFPPVQVAIPQHEFANMRNSGPKAFSGVVETTKEQQQLMRKVSALGMYDPVFGNVHKDMEISHASIVFEDMDLNDVPEDMRDLLGHTSEHTDPVMQKLVTGKSSPQSSENSGDEHKDFAPPRGSFARRVSRRNIDIPVGAPAITPSPPPPKGIKKPIGAHSKSAVVKDSGITGQNQFAKNLDFIPPTGSFNFRKPRERASTPTREALLKDIELAARAQSMFAEDSLLAMSASNLGQSISNLGASLGSINFDASATSFDLSTRCESEPKRSSIQQPRKRNSQSSPGGDLFVEPPAKTGDARRAASAAILPSDTRFSGAPATCNGASRKQNSHQRRPLARKSSTRSWEGDLDMVDPMATVNTSPMWASLSQLNTDFSTMESTLRN